MIRLSIVREENTYLLPHSKVQASLEASKIFRTIFEHEAPEREVKEYVFALYLNNNNEVVDHKCLSVGGYSASVVDTREVFATALLCRASGVILCHNHPSNQLKASVADRQLTRELSEAGKIMKVTLLDHIILTDASYYSFSDEGDL